MAIQYAVIKAAAGGHAGSFLSLAVTSSPCMPSAAHLNRSKARAGDIGLLLDALEGGFCCSSSNMARYWPSGSDRPSPGAGHPER